MFTSTDPAPTRPLPAALGARTLAEAFLITARERPTDVALRTPGADGVAITWAEYEARVGRIAAGLAARGVGRGDVVALALPSVPEVHLVDVAVLLLGAATVSVDAAAADDELAAALSAAGARVMVTDAEGAGPLARVTTLEHVVSIDGGDGASTLESLESGADPDFDLDAAAAAVSADDVALLVLAPGVPAAAQHTHDGVLAALRAIGAHAAPSPGGRYVSALSSTQVAERLESHYGPIGFGTAVTCCADRDGLGAALAEARPTRLLADERLLRDLGHAFGEAAATSPDVAAAVQAGTDAVDAIQAGCPPQFHPGVSPEHEAVLSATRAPLGLDELEWSGVAGPVGAELLRPLHAAGVPVAAFWGSPEALLVTSNPLEHGRLGSVGTALPGVEVRLADGGELLVRGGGVTTGYRDDAARTADRFDADGWLRTGTTARKDHEGYLTITADGSA